LPSNIGTSPALAVLTQCQEVRHTVRALAKQAHKCGWRFVPSFFRADGSYDPDARGLTPEGKFHSLSEAAIPEMRELLAQSEQLVAVWQELQLPATRRDIGEALTFLLIALPDATRNAEERELFQQMLCLDVGHEKPTVYDLQEACRRVRKRVRFKNSLTIGDLLQELAGARKLRKGIQLYLDAIPHMEQCLLSYEHGEPEQAAEEADADDDALDDDERFRRFMRRAARRAPIELERDYDEAESDGHD
jgi:hypothetical protein